MGGGAWEEGAGGGRAEEVGMSFPSQECTERQRQGSTRAVLRWGQDCSLSPAFSPFFFSFLCLFCLSPFLICDSCSPPVLCCALLQTQMGSDPFAGLGQDIFFDLRETIQVLFVQAINGTATVHQVIGPGGGGGAGGTGRGGGRGRVEGWGGGKQTKA